MTDPGEKPRGPGTTPLFLDQTEARRTQKYFFSGGGADPSPPHLSHGYFLPETMVGLLHVDLNKSREGEWFTSKLPNLEISRFHMPNIKFQYVTNFAVSRFNRQNFDISRYEMQNIELSRFQSQTYLIC